MILGIIGDDFTGSSDIANNLKKSGMQVSMYAGIPNLSPEDAKKQTTEAAVIALKTRTIPIKDAVKESLSALNWLKKVDADNLYLNIAQLLIQQKRETLAL